MPDFKGDRAPEISIDEGELGSRLKDFVVKPLGGP